MDIRLIKKVVITIPGDETKNEADSLFMLTGDWRLYLPMIEDVRLSIAELIQILSGVYPSVEFDFEIEADQAYERAIAKQEARELPVDPEHTAINFQWLATLRIDRVDRTPKDSEDYVGDTES